MKTVAPAPFVLGQTVRRLSYGLEPWQTVAPVGLSRFGCAASFSSRFPLSVVEVGGGPLGFPPPLARHPQGDVAVAEAIERPVGGEDRVESGLDQRLVPGPRR